MRAALYARVSTARQEQEETITSQLDEVKRRIDDDGNSLSVNNIFIDEGYSGSILERPSLDSMLDAAKRKDFDVLYIYDLGRLSRQLSHLLIVIEQLEKYERQVISLHERITGTPEDKFLLQIMGSMHEYEKAKIAERFRRGKMYKARSGKLVGYNAPYGYNYDKENGSFTINEQEADVVKKIFNWAANDSLSTYAIIHRLHEEGIKPRKAKQDYWTRGPIARILSNETYFGKHYFNKTEAIAPRTRRSGEAKYRRVQKTGRRIRPRDEWIGFDVPAIISEDLFYKARKQLERNVIFNSKNRKHQYLLTGLVKCPCGYNRNGDGPAGKKYYRCTSRLRIGDKLEKCNLGGLNVTKLDNAVWSELSSLLTSPDRIRQQAEKWLGSQTASKSQEALSDLTTQLKDIEAEERRYVDAYGKGLLHEDLFAEKIKDTSKRKESLQHQITVMSKRDTITGKIDINTLVEKATHKISELTFEEKKYIIERVVDKIVAQPKEITIWGHIPAPALVTSGKVNHVSQYRNRRPAKRRQINPIQRPNQ